MIDASSVHASGDGLDRVPVNRPTHFKIDTSRAGDADIVAHITSEWGELCLSQLLYFALFMLFFGVQCIVVVCFLVYTESVHWQGQLACHCMAQPLHPVSF